MKTFEELNLIDPLQDALADENYITPTPIQAKTIPAALKRRDILGCAQTGTGKTAAFALPILNRLGQQNRKAKPNRPYALILAPTRELAIQIGKSFEVYGRHLKLRHALVYGGVKQTRQVRAMNQGAHILVATPGRLLDLMNQGFIKLDKLEVFVLDEADRMLDMGFLPDLKRIIRELPKKRQSLFFSATLAPSIIELTKTLLVDPVSVNVTPKSRSVDRIEQRLVYVSKKGKQELLTTILYQSDVERAIVFTKTKRMANRVAERLNKAGIKSAPIHGNKSQNARQRAFDAFRNFYVQVLVATDVAARGIDIDGVSHVVNFDLPMEPEAYVHRIGRTGRAGAEGIAISFCSPGDQSDLREIEKLIKQEIPVDSELSDSRSRGSDERDSKSDSRSRRGKSGGRRRPKSSGQSGERGRSSGGKEGRKKFSKSSKKRSSSRDANATEGKRPSKRRRRKDRTAKAEADKRSRSSNKPSDSDRSKPDTKSSSKKSTKPSKKSKPGSNPKRKNADRDDSKSEGSPKRKRKQRKGKNARVKGRRGSQD